MTTRTLAATLFAAMTLLAALPAQEEKEVQVSESPQRSKHVVGLGGGPGGKYGARRAGRKHLRKVNAKAARAIELGLEWLKAHQDEDGRWDADGFMKHDGTDPKSTGPGAANADLIVTSLALHAFLADGSTLRSGPHKDVVRRAILWLRKQLKDNGAFGDESAANFAFSHAMATLVFTEMFHVTKYMTMRPLAQRATVYLDKFRLSRGGWSPDPKSGDRKAAADPMLGFWCTLVYMTARDAKLAKSADGLESARRYLDGLVGENGVLGSSAGRSPLGTNALAVDAAIRDRELAAAVLLGQFLAGEDPSKSSGGKLAIDAIAARTPEWKKGAMSYFEWFCASHLLYQVGGRVWQK